MEHCNFSIQQAMGKIDYRDGLEEELILKRSTCGTYITMLHFMCSYISDEQNMHNIIYQVSTSF